MAIIGRENGVCYDPAVVDALGAVASSLYREIGSADGAELEKMPDDLIREYFPEG